MVLRLLGLLCFGLLAGVADQGRASQACTVGTTVIAASIDRRSPAVERVVSSRRISGPAYEEVVKLKNGPTITLTVGGCHHFGVRLKAAPLSGVTGDAAPEALVRIARDLVRDLPAKPSAGPWLDDIRSSLDLQAGNPDLLPIEAGYAFACGEYKTCELTVPQGGILELSYVFAL